MINSRLSTKVISIMEDRLFDFQNFILIHSPSKNKQTPYFYWLVSVLFQIFNNNFTIIKYYDSKKPQEIQSPKRKGSQISL